MIRIAFCCLEWAPVSGGGIRTYVESVTRILLELGHEVHVITFAHPGAEPDEPVERLHVHRLRFAGWLRLVYGGAILIGLGALAFRVLYAAKVARKVAQLSAAGAVDVVETPEYAAEGVGITWLQRRRAPSCTIPHVVMLHTPTYLLRRINRRRWGPLGWVHERIENWNIRNARHVSSPSEALARRVTQDLSLTTRVHIDPYPSDVVRDAPEPSEAGGGAGTRILYVGRLEYRKGVTLLIDALNELGERHPELSAQLIGGDTATAPGGGSMLQHLRGRLSRHLHERVRFVDRVPRSELFAHYRDASFCVFPSVFENFANTCLEAIAFARVVVVPRDSGMAEMVRDGISGFLFDNGDVADLVRAIEQCMSRRAQWCDMGRAGREYLVERFDPVRMVEAKVRHYEQLVR